MTEQELAGFIARLIDIKKTKIDKLKEARLINLLADLETYGIEDEAARKLYEKVKELVV